METQKAIELIEKSGHIALVLPPNASLDCLASAEVLCVVLRKKEKVVGFLGQQNDGGGVTTQSDMRSPSLALPARGRESLEKRIYPSLALPAGGRERAERKLPREFIISIDAGESPIAELRYEKSGDTLDIILSPKSAPITEKNVSFREGKVLCDCAILIGIADPEALNGSFGVEPDFFEKTPLINIDISSQNKLYGVANLMDGGKTALAEIVYEFATAISAEPLDNKSATLLLAAIFEKTSGLQASLSAEILMIASELLRLGANKEEALALAKDLVPIELLQLFGRASVRSKIDGERGVLWSFLTSEDFEKTGRSEEDASRVLGHLEKSFPPHRLRVLLWQNSASGAVGATLAGQQELLQKISERAPSEFQSPDIQLKTSFDSFREGEGYISALLKEVL